MADVERFVDTASSGGDGTTRNHSGGTAAYASLSAWLSAEATDLVTATDTHRVRCAGSTADGTAVDVDGWVNDASFFPTIQGDDAAVDSDGFYGGDLGLSTGHYRLDDSGDADVLEISDEFVVVDGIQVVLSRTSNFSTALRFSIGNVTAINNRIVRTAASGNSHFGIEGKDSNDDSFIKNNIVYGFNSSSSVGILHDMANFFTGTYHVYNNTVFDNTDGIEISSRDATLVAKNNVVANNTNDFLESNGTLTIDYNAIDDADVQTNGVDISPGGDENADWDLAMTDPTPSSGEPDFTLKDGDSVLDGAGIPQSSDSEVPTLDILGVTRDSSAPDIGAFEEEFAAGAPPIINLVMAPYAST